MHANVSCEGISNSRGERSARRLLKQNHTQKGIVWNTKRFFDDLERLS
jgi:hypothetical protein